MSRKARSPHRWLMNGLALVAGGLVGLGFPPFGLWWLVPVGVAAMVSLALLSRPAGGLLRGYLFGFGFNLVAFHWIGVLGWPVVLVFVAWLALWQGLVGLVLACTRRSPAWGFAGVAAWMAGEWLCARWPFGGFGWGRLAYPMADSPLNGLFPFISVTGVSLVVVSTGFLLAWVVRPFLQGRRSVRGLSPVALVLLVVTLVVSTTAGLLGRSYDPAPQGRTVTVAVVQGNVPGRGADALGPKYTVENNHLAQTILLAARIRTGQASGSRPSAAVSSGARPSIRLSAPRHGICPVTTAR